MKERDMAAIERMTVVFPEPMANLLREAVTAGEYATTSEVVRAAVRLWSAQRRLHEQDTERLKAAWAAGQASGTATRLSMASIIAEAEAEHANEAEPRG
jgi:antitoxin ParD1/3/4